MIGKVSNQEYQKKALPHTHNLIWIEDNDDEDRPRNVDRAITAEIPNPILYLELHELVMRHMVHGPCGPKCLGDNGVCTKGFPKPFSITVIGNGSYPLYRRRSPQEG